MFFVFGLLSQVRIAAVSAINALTELSCALDTNEHKSGKNILASSKSSVMPQHCSEVINRNVLIDAALLRWRTGTGTTIGVSNSGTKDSSEENNDSIRSNPMGAAEAEGLLSLLSLQLGAMPWPERERRWQRSNTPPRDHTSSSSISSLSTIEDLVLEAAQWPGASSVRQAAADLATATLFGGAASRPSGELLSASTDTTSAVLFATLDADACVAAFHFVRKLARISAGDGPQVADSRRTTLPSPSGATNPQQLTASSKPTSSIDNSSSSATAASNSIVEEEGLLLCQDSTLSEVLVHAILLHLNTPTAHQPERIASPRLLRYELGRTLWPTWHSDDATEDGAAVNRREGLWGQVARSLNSYQSFEVIYVRA